MSGRIIDRVSLGPLFNHLSEEEIEPAYVMTLIIVHGCNETISSPAKDLKGGGTRMVTSRLCKPLCKTMQNSS
jgi:hypothetical protein